VRRRLVEFLAAAVAARPSAPVLAAAAPCLAGLLGDVHSGVAQDALGAAYGTVQGGMIMLAMGPHEVREG
jgi:hypothetical protein